MAVVLYVDEDADRAVGTATAMERAASALTVHARTDPEAAVDRVDARAVDCVAVGGCLRTDDGRPLRRVVDEQYPDLPVLVVGDGAGSGAGDPLPRDGEALATAVLDAVDTATGTTAYAETLTELHAVATDLLTSASVDEICERTVTAAERILDFDLCVVNVAEDGYLVPRATSAGLDPEGVAVMDTEEGIAGKTFQSGESLRVENLHADPDATPKGDYRSALSIPVGDRGVFQAVARDTGSFEQRDVELAELLISHATNALDRLDREAALRRRNDRLEEFASIVSHDLRNPLHVAEGHLELARAGHDSDHLAAVADAHDRMGALIEDLLTLARQGERATETEPVDLADTAEAAWTAVGGDDATLRVESERTVRADPVLLRQVLENLLKNSVDHGGDVVRVGDCDEGFYVADDGPGIPPEDRDQVFEAGYSTAEDGTGFGLRIVEQAARAHGWTVAVTGSDTGGARFEITGVTRGEPDLDR